MKAVSQQPTEEENTLNFAISDLVTATSSNQPIRNDRIERMKNGGNRGISPTNADRHPLVVFS